MMKATSKKLKSIELFAGAGGLAIATEKAGFSHVAAVEWDRNACDTMRLNKAGKNAFLNHAEIIEGDVAEVNFKHYRDNVDFISGGPPCQPFSIGGKHKGHDDNRDMFPHAVRAVREIQPSAFIFENVKGMLRPKFENYFTYCLHQLRYPNIKRCGDEEWVDHLARLEEYHTKGSKRCLRYNVVHQLLNAADFGVPQARQRVLIVGVRADLGMKFSFPIQTHSRDKLLYDQWVSGEYWDEHGVPAPKTPEKFMKRVEALSCEVPEMMLPRWRTVRDAIADLPDLMPNQYCSKFENHYFNPGARIYAGHNGSPYDWPAKTLKAGAHGVPGGENMLRREDESVRYFSVRECARLQTFPDQWVFSGSWTETMRQLGNAVPVQMVSAVARKLHNEISKSEHVMRVVREHAVIQ